ncbi:MAG: hypothetical protein LJE68_05690 [Rhodobacter sp.]|nr:hypothetical protein [Rhodobacter sp.]
MDLSAFFAHPLFIAIAPAATAGGLAWLAGRYRIKQLEGETSALSADVSRKLARIEELERSGRDSASLETQARAIKSALISKLNDLLEFGHGSRATLYLPVNDSEGEFLGLLILCTAPTNLADSSFHGTVFAGRDAFAMQSYLDREIVQSDGSVYRFDGFSPTATFADCIFEPGRDGAAHPIGVVQILFDSSHDKDIETCKSAVARVSPGLVDDLQFFLSDTRARLAMIGLNIPEQSKRGVVLFFDVSNSSQLFTNEARVSVTMAIMRRFMEVGVSTVTAEGGVIEGFTGDGFIASFAVTADASGPSVFERALRAARSLLRNSQDALKSLRPQLGDDFDLIKPRVGMATGVVHGISFSFGQMRVASVIGRSASNASIVCNTAPRDRPCITMDKATWLELPDHERASFQELDDADLNRKAKARRLSVFVNKVVE